MKGCIRKQLFLLFRDTHLLDVVRGTAIALVLKVIGSGLAFVFSILVARMLGAEGAGLYFLALAVVAVGSVIGRAGLNNALLRYVATHAAKNEWKYVKAVHKLAIKFALVISGLISITGYLTGGWIATEVFNKPELEAPLKWMMIAIVPYSLLVLHSASLKGISRVKDAMLVDGIFLPFFGLAMLWFFYGVADVQDVSVIYLTSAILSAAIGGGLWRLAMAGHRVEETTYSFKSLWSSAKPLYITSIMSGAVLPWAPLLLLGVWVNSDQVGIFGAANRVAMMISFLQIAANNVIAPKFAELFAKGTIADVESLARKSTALIVLIITPVFLLLMAFNSKVMLLFGEGFDAGGEVLVILLFGQFVNIASGSVNFLLIMSGNETITKNITIVASVIQVGFLLILSPLAGILGAAFASSAAIIILNTVSLYFVYKKLGIMVVPILPRMQRG